MKVPHKGLDKDWRFKKTIDPDPGTYDTMERYLAKSSTVKRPLSAKFAVKDTKRFTELYAEARAHVPGPGAHETDLASKKLSRPPSANRRRR